MSVVNIVGVVLDSAVKVETDNSHIERAVQNVKRRMLEINKLKADLDDALAELAEAEDWLAELIVDVLEPSGNQNVDVIVGDCVVTFDPSEGSEDPIVAVCHK